MEIPISISSFLFMQDPAPWSVEGKGLGAYCVVTLGKAMSSVALLDPESLFARLAWERVAGQIFFVVLDLCCGCQAILA